MEKILDLLGILAFFGAVALLAIGAISVASAQAAVDDTYVSGMGQGYTPGIGAQNLTMPGDDTCIIVPAPLTEGLIPPGLNTSLPGQAGDNATGTKGLLSGESNVISEALSSSGQEYQASFAGILAQIIDNTIHANYSAEGAKTIKISFVDPVDSENKQEADASSSCRESTAIRDEAGQR